METKPAKTQRTSLDREAWIKGAIAVMAEHGTEQLRVEVLAKRLSVTKGSFYWHFKDRRDLQDSVLEFWKEGRIRDIRKQTQAQAGGEAAALLHTIEVYSSARNRKGIAIEAAVRDWARRDAQAVRAVLGEDGDRGLDPCVAIEHGADWFAGLLFHAGEYRTFHTDAYVLFDSFCR